MTGSFLAFLGVSAVVIVTPGQDTALTVRNTLLGGRRGGILTALGVSAGQAFWTAAASAGITALLVASQPAFTALRLAGAAYLVHLGARSLWSALVRPRPPDPPAPGAAGRGRPPRALAQGVVSNLGNPKMAVFFTSLLPQFAPQGRAAFLPLLALGLVFCSLTLVWLTCYAIAVSRARAALGRPAVRRALDGVMGAALVGFGIRLAAQPR
ncbi:MAG TPA: LysE family translocator [Actinomycetes bacterium]|nr:LysE family translocator [Actinomycetes bacterium]